MKWKSKELPLGSFFVMKGFLRLTGPMGRRVLKVLRFDGPSARGLWYRHWTRLRREGSEGSEGSACLRQAGSKGGGIALRVHSEHDWQEQRDAPIIVSRFPFRGDEFYNSAPRNGEPYNRASPVGNAPLLPTASPPEGEILAVLCLVLFMRVKAERRANFPLRGKSPQGNRGAFPSGVSPVVRFSRRRHVYSSPHSGDTITLSPERAVKPPNPPTEGRSIFRTFRARRALNLGRKAVPLT